MNPLPDAVLPLASSERSVSSGDPSGGRTAVPHLNLLRKHHEVLSLDVYDTALQRPFVSPIHLFGEAENHVRRLYGIDAARGLAVDRIEAERTARHEQEASLEAGHSDREDIRYHDIQRHLRLRRASTPAGALDTFFAQELLLERTSVRANPEVLELFRTAKRSGRVVGFVSEMYLPTEVIAEALTEAGYEGWDFLHVSSATGSLKRTQKAFHHLLSHTAREPSRILHVGDHPSADGSAPRGLGIDAQPFRPRYWCGPNVGTVCAGTEVVSREMKAAYPGDGAYSALAPTERLRLIGEMLGPLLVYPWVRWLIEKVRRDDLRQLYFLPHEGAITKRVFDVWANHDGLAIRTCFLPITSPGLGLAALSGDPTRLLDALSPEIEEAGGPGVLRRLYLRPDNPPRPARPRRPTDENPALVHPQDPFPEIPAD